MNPESTAEGIAVIIVNYGDPGLLEAGIGRLPDTEHDLRFVIVDNFHSPVSRSRTRDLCAEHGWLFVPSENDGFGAGVNRGVEAAADLGCRCFITLNPDATASIEVLQGLGSEVAAHPRSLAAPWMDSSDGRPHFRGTSVSMRTGQIRSSWSPGDDDPEWKNWLSGACLAFSLTGFRELGGFSEDYFLYWEDVDISRRAALLGMRLTLRDDLTAIHDEGGTQANQNARAKSPTYYYYNIRNRFIFGRRMVRGRAWATWLLASPRQSLLIWLRGGRRQALTDPRGVWASIRGYLSGTRLTCRPAPSQRGADR